MKHWRWLAVFLLTVLGLLFPVICACGIALYPLSTEAMAPTYPEGSLLFVRSADPAEIRPGQVITYLESPSQVSTCRVLQKFPDPKEPSAFRFRVQGDGFPEAEAALVHSRNVLGTPVLSLPGLGRAAGRISLPLSLPASACLCVSLVLLLFPPEKIRKARIGD